MEDLLRYMFAYFWVWIPILGILAGSFSEWLKHKEKLAKLGQSTGDLETEVDSLKSERADLIRRLQNLEAIVTHEVWEARQEKDPVRRAARIDEALLEVEPSDAERAAKLAGRLRS
ncbi:MAG: hypothetical protein JJ896_10445 [Rhodothermales bacterium]|nr:hypothetical protein [Rhodothermales bacterium]MBO6780060.1 hypothetical protein [Rhodothermales bacterium]